MELLYFKSKKGNFGDDLNPWLWPQLIPDFDKHLSDTCFVGIGSILHNDNKSFLNIKHKKKIVFGSGIRESRDLSAFEVDDTWDIKFLRGPLSSKKFANRYPYIADSAYCIRLLDGFEKKYLNLEKEYKISLMPYFHSTDLIDWRGICDKLGYHYISPHSENGVEDTLVEIAKSEFLITEAMHGAILADVLRVPWHRFVFSSPFTEGEKVSEFKWKDWLGAIEIGDYQYSIIDSYKFKKRFSNILTKIFLGKNLRIYELNEKDCANNILSILSTVKDYYLSDDELVLELDAKFKLEIDTLKKSFSR